MKITPYHTYSATGTARVSSFEKNGAAAAGAFPEEAKNVDRIDISSSAMRAEVEKTARAMTQQTARAADTQRLEKLRSAVQAQTYFVPTDRLVDAMMTWRTL